MSCKRQVVELLLFRACLGSALRQAAVTRALKRCRGQAGGACASKKRRPVDGGGEGTDGGARPKRLRREMQALLDGCEVI